MAIEFSIIPDTPNTLLAPNITKILKFAQGDLGIADNITINTLALNLSKSTTPDSAQAYLNLNKVQLLHEFKTYINSAGKINIPTSDFILDPTRNSSGLKAFELSIVKTIFETLKPFMGMVTSLSGVMVKLEDLTAITLAIGGASLKPIFNSKSLGYKISQFSLELTQIQNLSKNPTNANQMSNTSNQTGGGTETYTVISTEYSTGTKLPGYQYTTTYKDVYSTGIVLSGTSSPIVNQSPSTDNYYHAADVPYAASALSSITTDILTNFIPQIDNILTLFSNPQNFITTAVIETLGETFDFLGKDFLSEYSQLKNLKPSDRASFVNNSIDLKKYVTVATNGDYKFLLDGDVLIKLFSVSFGLNLKDIVPIPITSAPNNTQEQPILKALMNIISMPIQMVKSIIDYIKTIFTSITLSNLEKTITDFMTFEWIKQFVSPSFILSILGITLDLNTLKDWIKNVKSFPDNFMFDLNKIIKAPFISSLPVYTKTQFLQISNLPCTMINKFLGFLEGIVNGVIEFIYSLLGLEAILTLPIFKLSSPCSADDLSVDELAKLLTGRGSLNNDSNFIYNILLPDGRNVSQLNDVELENFISENRNLNFSFQF
jgi:hypothetical protein